MSFHIITKNEYNLKNINFSSVNWRNFKKIMPPEKIELLSNYLSFKKICPSVIRLVSVCYLSVIWRYTPSFCHP